MLGRCIVLSFLFSCTACADPPAHEDRNSAVATENARRPMEGSRNRPATDEKQVEERNADTDEAQGAAQLLQRYFAFIEAGKYRDAWKLRAESDGKFDEQSFVASFDRYAEYHANIGSPGPAAESEGTSFVEVPVQLYGRMKDGSSFSSAGTVTVRKKKGGEWRVYSRG